MDDSAYDLTITGECMNRVNDVTAVVERNVELYT